MVHRGAFVANFDCAHDSNTENPILSKSGLNSIAINDRSHNDCGHLCAVFKIWRKYRLGTFADGVFSVANLILGYLLFHDSRGEDLVHS